MADSSHFPIRRALGLGPDATPFPWQIALLEEWFAKGLVPRALDVPTGLGKTSVIAIWLAARAMGASLPRRLVYVVDRRAVVDQATEEAERLRALLGDLPRARDALGLTGALPISTLRGQHADNREWLDDPARLAIVVGTVDMIGSRLLFEGYRCSRKMRPYHAALLGTDALVVLDEAHLVPPFERLLESIASDAPRLGPRAQSGRPMVPRLRFLALSATGRSTSQALSLGPDDLEHGVARRRLHAPKRLQIREALDPTRDDLASRLVEEAWQLVEDGRRPRRVIVFCDQRKVAQAVAQALRAKAVGSSGTPVEIEDPQLLVGGRRVHERVEAARWLRAHGYLAGDRTEAPRPAFVVATSAGEVGVDLDADDMVCDLVAWERIVQRLGRVNRRGNGTANVVVVPEGPDEKTIAALKKFAKGASAGSSEDAAEDDPEAEEHGGGSGADLKPEERARVRRHHLLEACLWALRALPPRDGAVDASPASLGALRQREPERIHAATTPAPLHPELTRAVVESWSMTSLREHAGRPEVAPWLRGWVDEEPQTAVVWRRYLPIRRDEDGRLSKREKREVASFFEAAPLSTPEILDAETHQLVEWLQARARTLLRASAAPNGDLLEPDGVATLLLDSDGEFVCEYRLRELQGSEAKDRLRSELPGRALVVDLRLGGLSAGLLDASSDEASDLTELAGVPFRVARIGEASRVPEEGWREELRLVLDTHDDGSPREWLVVDTDLAQRASTEEGRSTGREQSLAEHEEWVERRARDLALRLGLAPDDSDLLALAAGLHDGGKEARRWQRAFGAPPGKPLAKSTRRPNLALLDGYRHELGSLLRAERNPRVRALDPERRDLLLHLIAAHHGWARPILPTSGCDDAPPSALTAQAREVALRFARLEKTWGPWGLAWWEALLRAADQQASRDNDPKRGVHG